MSKKKYFSGLTKNTFLLTLTSLFADISTEMLYPILPVFLTQYLGASGSIVGLIEGVATATQNIQMGFAGYISDKMHKRKSLAIIGYIIAALSKPFIGFAKVWQGVFAARFMDRFGTGTRSAPRDALIAASADEKNRGKAFGLEGIGDNLGAFLGPIIAVILLFYFKVPIRMIFYLAIIPGLIAVVMVLFVKEQKSDFKSKSKLDMSFSKLPKSYWKYLGIIAVFGIGNISSSFMILQTKNIGISLIGTILIYAVYNLIAAIVSYPSGFLSDKFGRKNVLMTSFVVFIIALIGFAITRNFIVIAILFAFYGAFQGIFRAVGKAYAADFVPPDLRASGVGWFNTVVGLSGMVSGLTAGRIYDKIGHSSVFIIAAVFVFIGAIMLAFFKNNLNKNNI
jgi:MFS family permease